MILFNDPFRIVLISGCIISLLIIGVIFFKIHQFEKGKKEN